jgi:hypothetical protein
LLPLDAVEEDGREDDRFIVIAALLLTSCDF